VKAATAEDLGEDVSGSGHALTGGSSDTDTEGLSHGSLPELARVSIARRQRNIERRDRNGSQGKVASVRRKMCDWMPADRMADGPRR
jgi:hypothetical protein